jgi:large conductance mechanosensitive channel
MKELAREFREFALKGNVIDLALAVVIGGAFGKIVSALVADLIMPVVGAILPGQAEWRAFTVTPLQIKIGDMLGAILDFILISLVLFLLMVKLLGAVRKQAAPPAPPTKTCPECLETIPLKAKRCRACTAVQPA